MSDTTTHLGLPYLLAAQAQKHVTHNEALRLLDAMVLLSVLDRTRTAPPQARRTATDIWWLQAQRAYGRGGT